MENNTNNFKTEILNQTVQGFNICRMIAIIYANIRMIDVRILQIGRCKKLNNNNYSICNVKELRTMRPGWWDTRLLNLERGALIPGAINVGR